MLISLVPDSQAVFETKTAHGELLALPRNSLLPSQELTVLIRALALLRPIKPLNVVFDDNFGPI